MRTLTGFGTIAFISLAQVMGACSDKDEPAAGTPGPSLGGSAGDAGLADQTPAELGIVSGARLKQEWLRGGGAALPWRTVDSELEVRCDFSVASDGALRCLPLGPIVLYGDADCTEPLIADAEDDGCSREQAPYALRRVQAEGCDVPASTRVFEAGARIDTPAAVYQLQDGECAARDVQDGEFFRGASEVDPGVFVAGEYVDDTRGAEVGVRWIHATDDAWFPHSLVNLQTDQPCEVVTHTSDGVVSHRCVTNPARHYSTGSYGYADAACSEGAAAVLDDCTEPEAVASIAEDEDGCWVHSVLDVGEPIGTLYAGDADSCSEATEPLRPREARVSVGGPAAGLVELTRGNAPSDGRLTTGQFASGSVPVSAEPILWDLDHEAVCDVFSFDEGVFACIPSPYIVYGAGSATFRDAECTQPVVPGYDLTCRVGEFGFIIYQHSDDCGVVYGAVYEAGASFSTDTVYVGEPGACSESATNPDTTWVERGPEVALEDAFQILTVSSD